MYRGTARRTRLSMLFVVALAAALTWGCGDDSPEADVGRSDTNAADAGDGADSPGAILDANLPQRDPDVSVPELQDASSEDADAYTLPANSITTCGGFFECLQECPPNISCNGACHDAMTDDAASLVQMFISCVNANACSNEHCIMRECGMELEACFNDR